MTASPPVDSTDCRSLPDDHNTLFARGTALINPYMNLLDQSAAASKDRETHLKGGIACLDRVLRITPGHWQSLWVRGKALQALGAHQDARASLTSAYAAQPDHPDVARELVIELIEVGDFREAVRIASETSLKHPENAGLRANLALALVLDGQVSRAQSVVDDALAHDPNDRITAVLKVRIDEIASGKRKQPKTIRELERDDG